MKILDIWVISYIKLKEEQRWPSTRRVAVERTRRQRRSWRWIGGGRRGQGGRVQGLRGGRVHWGHFCVHWGHSCVRHRKEHTGPTPLNGTFVALCKYWDIFHFSPRLDVVLMQNSHQGTFKKNICSYGKVLIVFWLLKYIKRLRINR